MKANPLPEPPAVGSQFTTEDRRRILQKVQHCRGWLSILRAAGRHQLFCEQQRMLGELDNTMEEVLEIHEGRPSMPSALSDGGESGEMIERILITVKQCLEDLNNGHGLSKESRSRLYQLRRSASLFREKHPL